MSEQPSAVEPEFRPTEPVLVPRPVPGSPTRKIRLHTVLLGLVGLGTAVTVLVTQFTDREVDAQLVALVALIGSGTALLLGGITAALKEARSQRNGSGPRPPDQGDL